LFNLVDAYLLLLTDTKERIGSFYVISNHRNGTSHFLCIVFNGWFCALFCLDDLLYLRFTLFFPRVAHFIAIILITLVVLNEINKQLGITWISSVARCFQPFCPTFIIVFVECK